MDGRRLKRRIVTILIFLLLGAIVNVAVAWGLDYWLANAIHTYWPGVRVTEKELVRWCDRTPELFEYPFELTHGIKDHRIGQSSYEMLSGWDPGPADRESSGSRVLFDEAVIVDRRGWPMISLEKQGWYRHESDPQRSSSATVGVLHLPRTWDCGHTNQMLPLRPIWPGFLINTVFYTAILWPLYISPFILRRHIRHKRGRCIKCGYDLRGDLDAGCPECGWNRESEAAT